MPLRGSVQLLLLSFRRRATRRAGAGIAILALLGVGAVQVHGVLPPFGEEGFTQALRQSVWKQALADRSQTPWPWEDLSSTMSLAPGTAVPRLGVSAALHGHSDDAPGLPKADRPERTKKTAARRQQRDREVQGDVAISDVTIGDSITFTAADGATCVYQVTGRRVVDPHLAATEAERFGGEASLFECSPLESLIMQATQDAAQGKTLPPVEPGADQQKL